MNQLFIEIEIQNAADGTEIYTSINSFIALYIYKYLRSPDNIKLNFVCTTLPCIQAKLKLNSEKLRRELTEQKIICKSNSTLQAIRDLKMPVFAKEDNTYISGMCAVCREIVVRQGNVTQRKLLGFKGSCLLAPAETSIWTRFCEVNIVESLNRILTTDDFDDLPQEVPRFEGHMNEPVRMHNIYKLARDNANAVTQNNDAMGNKKSKVVIDCKTPKEHLPIEHRFAEGIAFTIADLILYPCFRIIFERCQGVLEQFPLVNTWLCEIDAFDPFCQRTYQQLYTFPATMRKSYLFNIPDVERSSLYKSDPKRYKPRNRIFTEQSVVDASLAKLQKLQLKFNSDSDIAYSKMTIDWNEIEPEHERNSALPMERLERKRHQLENLANVVGLQANTGDRIVDFCSGTGHLGILLALQLPQCTVIFLENKPISLERAKKRALELKLENCQFYQCNIDYFEGQFNIGTSLHACGTATDIVLQQCMRSRAKFVCCPCCYGSLQPMPHISYPRSERFRSVLQEKDLLHIAHTADQAHELGTKNCRPETTRQGQLCMDIIDTDRKLLAEEAGYEVVLTRLKPENCTPKNRLLIGSIVNER